jgi:peptide/nickel transport system ATP-binding protein
MEPLLKIEELQVSFPAPASAPSPGGPARAVAGVSLEVQPGEIYALAGESGSGKSTLCKAGMGLLDPRASVQGRILLQGRDLLQLSPRQWGTVRGAAAGMVLQDAQNALHPFMTLARQLGESLRLDQPGLRGRRLRAACLELLAEAGFADPEQVIGRYPHQLSGGQAQRAVIAVVRARRPRLVIADEPTTAVDVTTQAQFTGCMRQIAASTGAAVLVVTHDFGLVSEIADRVGVMRHGHMVEEGPRDQMVTRPRQPYTRLLLQAARTVLLPAPEAPAPAAPRTPPSPAQPAAGGATVEAEGLSRIHAAPRSLLGPRRPPVRAVDDVSFAVPAGTGTGIGGESGCGKSSLSRLISGLDTPDAGEVRIGGRPVAAMAPAERAATVQYVFQNPYAAMNPRLRVFGQVREALDCLGRGTPKAREVRTRELLELMGLPPALQQRFPHELSGGQLQRAAIAAAMIAEPRVLVCDEPVSALDVSVRSDVLRAMLAARAELGTTILLVGHDLSLFRAVCGQLLIMYGGRIAEAGPAAAVLDAPGLPYTRHLAASAPRIGLERPQRSARLLPPDPAWRSHPMVRHAPEPGAGPQERIPA